MGKHLHTMRGTLRWAQGDSRPAADTMNVVLSKAKHLHVMQETLRCTQGDI